MSARQSGKSSDSPPELIKEEILMSQDGELTKDIKFSLWTDGVAIQSTERLDLLNKQKVSFSEMRLTRPGNIYLAERAFRIETSSNTYLLFAKSEPDADEWCKIISDTMLKFLDRIARESGNTPPVWVPDTLLSNCQLCDAQFGMFLRRHHCRHCGVLVCNSCSSKKIIVKHINFVHPVRVCNNCHNYFQTAKCPTTFSPPLEPVRTPSSSSVHPSSTTSTSSPPSPTESIPPPPIPSSPPPPPPSTSAPMSSPPPIPSTSPPPPPPVPSHSPPPLPPSPPPPIPTTQPPPIPPSHSDVHSIEEDDLSSLPSNPPPPLPPSPSPPLPPPPLPSFSPPLSPPPSIPSSPPPLPPPLPPSTSPSFNLEEEFESVEV